MNNRVFSNIDIDPRDSLKLAETESLIWREAQASITERVIQTTEVELQVLPNIPGRWCFTDGSWKENDILCGQRLMGARNTRASLTPLHSEVEDLIWEMECMKNLRQYQVTFATDCSQLVKMISKPEERPAFASYWEDIKILKGSFNHSQLIHISQTINSRADNLARSARQQSSFVVHMDAKLPMRFAES